MRGFKEIPDTQTISSSRIDLLNNDKTVMSNSYGSGFPTENLVLGMFCYRYDEGAGKLYQLISMAPDVWALVFDRNKTILYLEDANALYASLTANNFFTGKQTVSDGVRSMTLRVVGDAAELAVAGGPFALSMGAAGRQLTVDQAGVATFGASSFMVLPRGTSAQRGTPGEAAFRYNSTLKLPEFYNGSAWVQLGALTSAPGNFGVGGDLTVSGQIQLNGINGLYSRDFDISFAPEDTNWWGLRAGAGLRLVDGQGATKGALYHNASGFGLLNPAGGWSVRAWTGGGELHGTWNVAGELSTPTSFRVRNSGPTVFLDDTARGIVWGVHSEQDVAGFIRSGSWRMYVTSGGEIFTPAYGSLTTYIRTYGANGVEVSSIDNGGGDTLQPAYFYLDKPRPNAVRLVRTYNNCNCNCNCNCRD